jgi:hypothetical protein
MVGVGRAVPSGWQVFQTGSMAFRAPSHSLRAATAMNLTIRESISAVVTHGQAVNVG